MLHLPQAASRHRVAAWLMAAVASALLAACGGGDGGAGGANTNPAPPGQGAINTPPPVRIAAGSAHSCFITAAATVQCWGANDRGQLGNGSRVRALRPQAVPGVRDVVALVAGGDHTCALQESGTVLCWGAGTEGQLGNGQEEDSLDPVEVADLDGIEVLALTSGRNHSCVLTDDDRVLCWGSNASGQLGRPLTGGQRVDQSERPLEVLDLPEGLVLLGSGWDHNCVARNVAVPPVCWGANDQGQAGNGATAAVALPSSVQGLPANVRVRALAGGKAHSCLLTNLGQQFCWGSNASGELGTGTASAQPSTSAVEVVLAGAQDNLVAMSLGDSFTCAVKVLGVRTAGEATCWGRNVDGELGQDSTAITASADVLVVREIDFIDFIAVGSGDRHSCAVDAIDRVRCWGLNTGGQMGIGVTSAREDTPVRPLGLD